MEIKKKLFSLKKVRSYLSVGQTLGHYELGAIEVLGFLKQVCEPANVLLRFRVLVLGETQVAMLAIHGEEMQWHRTPREKTVMYRQIILMLTYTFIHELRKFVVQYW